MSWSVSFTGKPELVSKALIDKSANLSGQSKVEYDAALPHLKALVEENFDTEAKQPTMIKLNANGSGSVSGDKQLNRTCAVSIERIYGIILA